MNARLPDGATRIDAAKAAVADVVGKVAPGTRLALRAYGHQSPTQRKDCKDTALVVGFNDAGQNRTAIVDATRSIRAQGYTPINHSLTLAAGDLGQEESAERIVVLVSDGKETCEGDPCVTARALAAADAKLVVHTIGFGVDAAARRQLQCIAAMARAASRMPAPQRLAAALGGAARKPVPPKTESSYCRAPDWQRDQGPDQDACHRVFDAATGQQAKLIRSVSTSRSDL
jgi:Ca-activated chloride channel family protein